MGPGFALLLKAAADAGLQTDWYTYYAGGAGGPTAIKQTGLSHRVFADRGRRCRTPLPRRHKNGRPTFALRRASRLFYPRAVNEMRMLAKAVNKAKIR